MVSLSTLRCFFAMRCPACRRGAIYRSTFVMNERCPECGVVFEREPGYFIGSLYVSYAFAIVILGLAMLAGHLIVPTADLFWIALVVIVLFIPVVPQTTRYARVLWMYVDRAIWPAAPRGD